MASANHSEQKGQDWGEEREGTQPLALWPTPLPQGVDPRPRVDICSPLPTPCTDYGSQQEAGAGGNPGGADQGRLEVRTAKTPPFHTCSHTACRALRGGEVVWPNSGHPQL